MEKGRFDKAFSALCRLRKHKIQATRDMYYAYKLLEVEQSERAGRSMWKEFFTVRRNRRAAQSSFFVMFMQQFCGVNVIAYYSKFALLSFKWRCRETNVGSRYRDLQERRLQRV